MMRFGDFTYNVGSQAFSGARSTRGQCSKGARVRAAWRPGGCICLLTHRQDSRLGKEDSIWTVMNDSDEKTVLGIPVQSGV